MATRTLTRDGTHVYMTLPVTGGVWECPIDFESEALLEGWVFADGPPGVQVGSPPLTRAEADSRYDPIGTDLAALDSQSASLAGTPGSQLQATLQATIAAQVSGANPAAFQTAVNNAAAGLDLITATDQRALKKVTRPLSGWDTMLGGIKDTAGRVALWFTTAGQIGIQKLLIGESATAPGGATLKSRGNTIQNDQFGIGTADGKAALVVRGDGRVSLSLADDAVIPPAVVAGTEVVTARGSRTVLNDRLTAATDAYGLPARGGWLERLRWTRMITRQRINGDAAQFDVLLIGDSYTQNATRWSGVLWKTLTTLFGDAGVGWVGFAYPTGSSGLRNGSVRPDVTVSETGTWTPTYVGTRSPDLGEHTSSTVGDRLNIVFPTGQSSAKLYHIVTAGASVTATFNPGGVNQTVDLSVGGAAGTLAVVTLTGISGTSNQLLLTVAAGAPVLCGVDIRSTANGVRVHKVASTGTKAQQWAAAAADASWRAGILSLRPQLVIVMHGANDQAAARTATQFAGDMTAIVNGLNTTLGATTYDRFLVAQPENQQGKSILMRDYQTALEPVADTLDAAYLNTQPFFGVNPADYAFGSPRPWFASDLLHPDPPTGGRVLADAIIRPLLKD